MRIRSSSSKKFRGFSTWQNLVRRREWFASRMTLGTAKNFALASTAYATGATKLRSLPVALKVDISPVCNLRCPFCVHGTANPKLKPFHKGQRMTVEQFGRLVNEIKGRTSAISLYYLGDPLTHPDLSEMCGLARDAGIYTYVSTNFSFDLSDEDIDRLASSGLSHLKVCVDGLTQEIYEQSRTGGKIAKVLNNLERICEARKRLNSEISVEVQYIVYERNRHEMEEARVLVKGMGVDEMTTYQGAEYTMEEIRPDNFEIFGPQDKRFPSNCFWPYFFMTIKWNGDVIPCCSHRQAEQYDPTGPPKNLLGNIFETSLEDVWNCQRYQDVRRFVSKPALLMESENPANEFCYGCKRVCKRSELTSAPLSERTDESGVEVYEIKAA